MLSLLPAVALAAKFCRQKVKPPLLGLVNWNWKAELKASASTLVGVKALQPSQWPPSVNWMAVPLRYDPLSCMLPVAKPASLMLVVSLE